MLYHARPRDLAKSALKRPREVAATAADKPLLNPIFTRLAFSSLPLDPRLSSFLEKSTEEGGMGLATSTRVQSVVVPLLSTPRNVLMKSQTGSGKTLAYLVPMIQDLMTLQPAVERSDGTRALIIAPTRELCAQIATVLAKLTQCCVRIVGGRYDRWLNAAMQ
jgi:superfamily II DNA/RNA helicase